MYKKHSIFTVLVLLFSSIAVFAAENIDMKQYRSTRLAYTQGYLKDIATPADLRIVTEHKRMLENRKQEIESSYMPLLINVIASSLVASSFGMFGYALSGSVAAYTLLNESSTQWQPINASGPSLGYFDYLQYLLGIDKGTIFWAKGKYTDELLKNISQNKQDVVAAGIAAPKLALGSLVTGALSFYLFKKAARYKDEVAQIEKEIDIDNAMLKVLGVPEPLIKK